MDAALALLRCQIISGHRRRRTRRGAGRAGGPAVPAMGHGSRVPAAPATPNHAVRHPRPAARGHLLPPPAASVTKERNERRALTQGSRRCPHGARPRALGG